MHFTAKKLIAKEIDINNTIGLKGGNFVMLKIMKKRKKNIKICRYYILQL